MNGPMVKQSEEGVVHQSRELSASDGEPCVLSFSLFVCVFVLSFFSSLSVCVG